MSPPSRRDVLRTAAALPAAAVPSVPEWAATRETRVMTRNLGLGAGLFQLLTAEDLDPERVYAKFREVLDSGVPTRMRAIAGEIDRERPAVVGVQEAATIRRGPSDGAAITPVVNFLAELQDGLHAHGAPYRVAVASENADVTLPAKPPDGEPFSVRLVDHDALLVREDVAVEGTATADYGLNARRTIDGRTLVAERGFCRADCVVDGVPLTAVATHLEASSALVRRVQAAELVDALAADEGAVAVLGDINSSPDAPEPSAYAMLTDALTDAWAVTDEPGPTCCQVPTLNNVRSRLRRRVDGVFLDGPVEPLSAHRTGAEPSARVSVGDRMLWPSDHAGVVAGCRIAPSLSDPQAVVRALL